MDQSLLGLQFQNRDGRERQLWWHVELVKASSQMGFDQENLSPFFEGERKAGLEAFGKVFLDSCLIVHPRSSSGLLMLARHPSSSTSKDWVMHWGNYTAEQDADWVLLIRDNFNSLSPSELVHDNGKAFTAVPNYFFLKKENNVRHIILCQYCGGLRMLS